MYGKGKKYFKGDCRLLQVTSSQLPTCHTVGIPFLLAKLQKVPKFSYPCPLTLFIYIVGEAGTSTSITLFVLRKGKTSFRGTLYKRTFSI
jgi:hypothetical protein